MTNKSSCCNAAITDHLTYIDYHGEGRTNFICCSECGKAAGDGLYQKSQQDYKDEMLTGTVAEPCSECGKVDATVRMRTCGYCSFISGKAVWHVVCDDCETTHILDI